MSFMTCFCAIWQKEKLEIQTKAEDLAKQKEQAEASFHEQISRYQNQLDEVYKTPKHT